MVGVDAVRCLPCTPGFLPQCHSSGDTQGALTSLWQSGERVSASHWAGPVSTAGLQHIYHFLGKTGECYKGLAEHWDEADIRPDWSKPQPTWPWQGWDIHTHWATCSNTVPLLWLEAAASACPCVPWASTPHHLQGLGWAYTPHISTLPGLWRPRGDREIHRQSPNPKKERKKEILLGLLWGFFVLFIGLGFLKCFSQHWKEHPMKQLEGTSMWRPALLPGQTAICCFSKETAVYILGLVSNILYARLTSLIHQGLLLSSNWSNSTSRPREPQLASWG